MSLHNLAAFYQDLGRTADAEALYKRALSIAAKTLGREHRLVAVGLNNLAQLYKSRDRYAEAEPLLKAAISIWEKTLGPDHPDVSLSLSNLAWLYLSRRDWAQAAQFWQKSTEIIIRRSGRGAQTRQSELASSRTSDVSQQRSQFLGLVKVSYRLAEADPAQATSIAARMFETAQWTDSSKAAQSLTQMAARQAKGDGALARLVRERQDLVGEWQAKDKLLIASVSQALAKRVAVAERELRDRLSLIDARVSAIDATLAREFPDYAALASPRPLSIAQVQALLSKDEALVLFLDTPAAGPTPEETFVWAVTQTGFRWLRVGAGTPSLEREVKALRCGLDFSSWKQATCSGLLKVAYSLQDYNAGRPLPFDAGRSHALYRTLLGSIEDLIRDKRLLVAASGSLAALPLQVLVTEKPATAVPADFAGYARISWLGQRHAITALPSVASLKALRDHAKPSPAAAGAFVGFGNPLLMGLDGNDRRAWNKQKCPPSGIVAHAEETLASITEPLAKLFRNGRVDVEELRLQPPLPETADELCAVARMAGADPDRAVHLGARASERHVKALSANGTLANARIIHFATHGLLADETELLSSNNQAEPALLLTPPAAASDDDDGLLTASEVASLKLNADWVILSACNTAAGGDKVGGEALSGLARAFFYAGARSLLVSHWYVDSPSTVALITTAFRELKSAPAIGWAEVMRRAMASLIAGGGRNAHPAYWAPFAVVGEGGAR
jgi:CHAT domain-containing protein